MINETDKTNVQEPARALNTPQAPGITDSKKKEFVEPQISAPADVLEATTFFITGDSAPSEA